VSTDDWFSSEYVPPPQRLEPVTLGEPLSAKGRPTAEARVGAIHGIGLELRYEWNGGLRASQVFRTWTELEQTADEKRAALEARERRMITAIYARKSTDQSGVSE
jgi:hypothetical protein